MRFSTQVHSKYLVTSGDFKDTINPGWSKDSSDLN